VPHRLAKRYRRTGVPQRSFSSFRYRAHPWSHQRRNCYKAEHAEAGTNLRFLVTNLSGRSASVFSFYNDRGEHRRLSPAFHFSTVLGFYGTIATTSLEYKLSTFAVFIAVTT
jgi:hypothetical protein